MSHTKSIVVPTQQNELLEKTLAALNHSQEITTLWKVININAIKRLGMTDHGPIHFQIVAENSLQMLRLLTEQGVVPSIVANFNLTNYHAEVVVLLASLLHDIGMSINRKGHEELSLFMTHTFLRELLDFMPIDERTIVIAETLHAIISHRKDGNPITIEAGIVRVADALDMSKGRSRIPYESGKIDIHSVSAQAIDTIVIRKGTKAMVQVEIVMNHTAGLFQVDELLGQKVKGSGLEKYLEIRIYIEKNGKRHVFKDFIKK